MMIVFRILTWYNLFQHKPINRRFWGVLQCSLKKWIEIVGHEKSILNITLRMCLVHTV